MITINVNPKLPLFKWANNFVWQNPDFKHIINEGDAKKFSSVLDSHKLTDEKKVVCWYVAFGYDTAKGVGDDLDIILMGMERSARLRVFKVDDRVIYKIGKNEWFVGTVVKITPTKVFVQYDDGFMSKTGTPNSDSDLFHYTGGTKLIKETLTDTEARLLKSLKENPIVAPPAKKSAVKPTPIKPATKSVIKPKATNTVYKGPGSMALIKFAQGEKWKYCNKLTPGSIDFVLDNSLKTRTVSNRFVLDWRAATPAEKKMYSEKRQDSIMEKHQTLKIDANTMVSVKYSTFPVWEYCFRINLAKGTFSVAGSGGKMRDLPLNLAIESREATTEEKERAERTLNRMQEQRDSAKPRRSKSLHPWLSQVKARLEKAEELSPELSPKQKVLDVNNDGKIDADDLKAVRNGEHKQPKAQAGTKRKRI